jgi:hypothetical protein
MCEKVTRMHVHLEFNALTRIKDIRGVRLIYGETLAKILPKSVGEFSVLHFYISGLFQ